jgi:hypothetical protein
MLQTLNHLHMKPSPTPCGGRDAGSLASHHETGSNPALSAAIPADIRPSYK